MEAKRLKPKRAFSRKVEAARKAAQDLILTQPDKEAEADNVLASLSVLAFPSSTSSETSGGVLPHSDTLVVDDGTLPSSRFKSKFFYRPTVSFTAEVQNLKQGFVPKAMEHIDAVVEERLVSYKKTMPAELQKNIKEVREYFLKELAPLTLASTAGASQAQDVVQRLLGGPVDGSVFDRYDRMLRQAVNMSMARFIAKYVKLPKDAADLLLSELTPKQPALVPIPFEPPERRAPQAFQQRTKPKKVSFKDEPKREVNHD